MQPYQCGQLRFVLEIVDGNLETVQFEGMPNKAGVTPAGVNWFRSDAMTST